jgi:hypothetical protein
MTPSCRELVCQASIQLPKKPPSSKSEGTSPCYEPKYGAMAHIGHFSSKRLQRISPNFDRYGLVKSVRWKYQYTLALATRNHPFTPSNIPDRPLTRSPTSMKGSGFSVPRHSRRSLTASISESSIEAVPLERQHPKHSRDVEHFPSFTQPDAC